MIDIAALTDITEQKPKKIDIKTPTIAQKTIEKVAPPEG